MTEVRLGAIRKHFGDLMAVQRLPQTKTTERLSLIDRLLDVALRGYVEIMDREIEKFAGGELGEEQVDLPPMTELLQAIQQADQTNVSKLAHALARWISLKLQENDQLTKLVEQQSKAYQELQGKLKDYEQSQEITLLLPVRRQELLDEIRTISTRFRTAKNQLDKYSAQLDQINTQLRVARQRAHQIDTIIGRIRVTIQETTEPSHLTAMAEELAKVASEKRALDVEIASLNQRKESVESNINLLEQQQMDLVHETFNLRDSISTLSQAIRIYSGQLPNDYDGVRVEVEAINELVTGAQQLPSVDLSAYDLAEEPEDIEVTTEIGSSAGINDSQVAVLCFLRKWRARLPEHAKRPVKKKAGVIVAGLAALGVVATREQINELVTLGLIEPTSRKSRKGAEMRGYYQLTEAGRAVADQHVGAFLTPERQAALAQFKERLKAEFESLFKKKPQ